MSFVILLQNPIEYKTEILPNLPNKTLHFHLTIAVM